MLRTFFVGGTPREMALNRKGSRLYVANEAGHLPSAGLIQVFTLQARRLAKSINVGGEPRRIGFSQQGHIAAVTNAAGFITFVR